MDIVITQSVVSLTGKQLKLDLNHLLAKLPESLLDIVLGDWRSIAKSIIGSSPEVICLENPPEREVWILIRDSLINSIVEAIDNFSIKGDKLSLNSLDINSILDEIIDEFDTQELVVNPQFFRNPKDCWLIEVATKVISRWLECSGIESHVSLSISSRVPNYFTYNLHEAWGADFEKYPYLTPLLQDIPFSSAAMNARSWLRYTASLEKLSCQPVFGKREIILKDIYIPLRGHYENIYENVDTISYSISENSTPNSCPKNRVFMVEDTLINWVSSDDVTDCLRVICGGPGDGKTSLVKMLSSELAARGNIPVIYAPLHTLQTNKDFEEALSEFISGNECFDLSINPLKDLREIRTPQKLLVILDGLDEIAVKESDGEESTKRFISNVVQTMASINQGHKKLIILLTGRDFSVKKHQEHYCKQKSIINLIPYCISREELGNYEGDINLIELDQRDEWWRKYEKITGGQYSQLPDYLDTRELYDITKHPLLNYLLAITLEDDSYTSRSTYNINDLYHKILKTVFSVIWRRQDIPNDLDESCYEAAMEIIATVAWHGDGLSAPVNTVKQRIKDAQLGKISEELVEGNITGINRLFSSFYLRPIGRKRFFIEGLEFTHQSFAEYLVARQLVELSKFIVIQREEDAKNFRHGFTEEVALVRWISLCGPKPLNIDLYEFVFREFQKISATDNYNLHMVFTSLFEYMLEQGMPMHRTTESLDYPAQVKQARNAEEALFAILHASALCSNTQVNIKWPHKTSFGDFMMRIRGQRAIDQEMELAIRCCGSLNLDEQVLIAADLYRAKLSHTQFKNARLENSDLGDADLTYANLQGANLGDANLGGAVLLHANLKKARLIETKLRGANLRSANLDGANLAEADLRNTNLLDTSFVGAKLHGAKIMRDDIQRSTLTPKQTEIMTTYSADDSDVV